MTERKLPSGWTWTTLGALGHWYGGGTPSKRNPEFWESGTIPWLSPKDMGASLLVDTQDHITKAAVAGSATALVPPNSVAFVVRSGILERRVPVALIPFSTTMNQDMKAIAPNAAVDPRWLLYTLQSLEQTILQDCRKAGTTVASLDTLRLRGLRIPVPPLPEQRRIVEALEAHLSRLDAADASVFVAMRRADAFDVARRSDSVSVTPETKTLPSSWCWRTLDELSSGSSYGTSTKCDLAAAGTPVVRIPNIRSGQLDFDDLKFAIDRNLDLSSLYLDPGDLLFVRTNGSPALIGRTAVVRDRTEMAFASYLIRFKLGSVELADWVQLVLSTHPWRHLIMKAAASSAGQYNLNQKFLKSLRIPVPRPSEQREILDKSNERADEMRRLMQVANIVGARSAALRRSILRAAFDGALVDQDPTDEHVGVTLAKLHAKPSAGPARTRKRQPSGG